MTLSIVIGSVPEFRHLALRTVHFLFNRVRYKMADEKAAENGQEFSDNRIYGGGRAYPRDLDNFEKLVSNSYPMG